MVVIQDNTIRDGMQQKNVKKDIKTKKEVLSLIAMSNIESVEMGMCTNLEDYGFIVEKSAILSPNQKKVILTRLKKDDIDLSLSLKGEVSNLVIKLLIPISNLHIEKKLNTRPLVYFKKLERILEYLSEKNVFIDVCLEDATRAELDTLFIALDIINYFPVGYVTLADTVGCSTPCEYGELFDLVKKRNYKFKLSAHCHNDLGMATANTFSAILNGAEQIETTFLGLGERAGNTSLDEIVTLLETKEMNDTGLSCKEIYSISKEIQKIIDFNVSPLKPIIGDNAFIHESGIHQDGMRKDNNMYQAINPSLFGLLQKDFCNSISGISSSKVIYQYFERQKVNSVDLNRLVNFYKSVSKVTDNISPEDVLEIFKVVNKNIGGEIYGSRTGERF